MLRDHPLLPFAATLAGVGLYSLMDAVMKGASLAIGAYSALLLRSLFSFAAIMPVWLATRDAPRTAGAVRLHWLRGAVVTGMALTFFWGIARLPLAEAIALAFVAPLIALYLAALLLGERIERRAIAASLLGVAGVMVIVAGRIGSNSADASAAWGMGAVLVSSVLYAWSLVLQRRQAMLAGPAEMATWQNGVVSLILLIFAPFLFEWPQAALWAGLIGASLLSLAGALLFAWAYARAEAQALVPLEYSGFLWAALFGWLFFAEHVGWLVVAGAGLIVAACWIAAPRKRPEQTAA